MNLITTMFFIACICIINILNAQEDCFEIDSIACYRIPWEATSVRNIHKNEVILHDGLTSLGVDNIIKDKQALQYFKQINIDSLEYRDCNAYESFNTRAVILIYYSCHKIDTLSFKKPYSFLYKNKTYTSNTNLFLWLLEYKPLFLLNPNSKGPDEKYIKEMREEHNFMNK